MGRVVIGLTIHILVYTHAYDIDFEPYNGNVGLDCNPELTYMGGRALDPLAHIRLNPENANLMIYLFFLGGGGANFGRS